MNLASRARDIIPRLSQHIVLLGQVEIEAAYFFSETKNNAPAIGWIQHAYEIASRDRNRLEEALANRRASFVVHALTSIYQYGSAYDDFRHDLSWSKNWLENARNFDKLVSECGQLVVVEKLPSRIAELQDALNRE